MVTVYEGLNGMLLPTWTDKERNGGFVTPIQDSKYHSLEPLPSNHFKGLN